MKVLNLIWKNAYLIIILYAVIAGIVFLYNEKQIVAKCGESCGSNVTDFKVEHNWCECHYLTDSKEIITKRRIVEERDLLTYYQRQK